METKHPASEEAFAYDVETFSNFFSVTFVGIRTNSVHQFVVHASLDQRNELYEFIDNLKAVIGFNGLYYDAPMMRKFMLNKHDPMLLEILYSTSQRLISDDSRNDFDLKDLRFPAHPSWRELDVMKLQAFDKLGIGLKQVAINLRWDRIQDLPIHYTASVNADQIPMILDYNLNDVLITKALYEKLKPEIELRKGIRDLYGVDVVSASDSKMANAILEKMMGNEQEVRRLRTLRTKRDVIMVGKCIPDKVVFRAPELNALLTQLKAMKLFREFNFQYKRKLSYNGVIFNLGVGGLHSDDPAGIFEASDDVIIRDADVASYYPSMMLNHAIRPEHLDEKFSDILKRMTKERLEAKKTGDDVKAAALKISINSVFGKLNSETFWLEDAQAFISVTIAGQLYLLMLIEMLTEAGIKVISANTDGVVSELPASLQDEYERVSEEWQKITHLQLEFTDYAKYIRKDVNNYVAIKKDGKGTKEKGIFALVSDLRKGFRMPIIQRCLYEYFVNAIPVDETLEAADDILDFCMSQKTGREFVLEYHTADGKIEKLQKNNRFFISKGGGSLIKRHAVSNRTISLYAGQWTRVLNWLDRKKSFDEYDIDYDFYRKEVTKVIEAIDPSIIQLSLF
jgi:hypothetical protein